MGSLTLAPSRKKATVLLAVGGYVNTGIVVAQGLLLVPLYLYYIGAHIYGLWLASGGILGMMTLVNFGIGSMLVQRVSRSYGEKNFEQTGAYFFNGIIVYLFICLLFGLLGWAFSLFISNILDLAANEISLLQSCFQIAVVAMAIGILNECLRSFSQALLRPVIPMVGMAVGRIVGIGGTVWMLFSDFGLWAIPVGLLIAEGIIFIVNLFYASLLFRWLGAHIKLDGKIIKEYAYTSPALFVARVGTTLSQESEPLLITLFLSPEVTTAYMITRKAADMISQMLSVVYGATHSAFSNLVGVDSERARKIAYRLLAIVFSSALVAFVTYVGANDSFVSIWVGQTFSLEQDVIFLIGAGFFIRSFRDMLWQLLNGWGEFIYSSYVILSEGFLRLLLMLLFLKVLGVVGVPLALLLSSFGSGMLLWMRLKKHLLWQNSSAALLIRPLVVTIILFAFSLPVAQFVPGIDSLAMFVGCLILYFCIVLLAFLFMNWRMCQWFVKELKI